MNEHELSRYLPPQRFGVIRNVTPLVSGLSGAEVDLVATDSGEYVVRRVSDWVSSNWEHSLKIHRLVATHGIAPPLELVDESTKVTVSRRIDAPSASAAFGNPATRPHVIASLVSVLASLHSLPADGVADADAASFAREVWNAQCARPGFPAWALPLAEQIDRCEQMLARDRRRVLSHNDANPGNILWDGERVWLVDWDAAALSHPYYDLATISIFLNLSDADALALLSAQERAEITPDQAETFRALRRLAGILTGAVFMQLISDLTSVVPARVDEAPTLAQFYAMLRTGAVELRSAAGQAAFGSALFRQALDL